MPNPRIAIVGAGPGGLLCARVLQGHGLDVTVYDTDASTTARDPGGTLDLHADTGQLALEDAGLLAEFRARARVADQAKARRDHHGALLSSYTPREGDTAAPEIDRGQLRALLAESVRTGTVAWGHTLREAVPQGEGVHRLHFADGTHTDADLVIGADGAWSRVRPLLTDAVPRHTGVVFLDVRYDDVTRRHPELAQLVGEGHLFSRDGAGRGIIAQRNSDDVLRAYLAFRAPARWHRQAGVELADTAAVHRFLRAEFAAWAPELQRFLTEVDGAYVNRPIHALPAPLTWERTPGVTLLGDAAHLMTPFGGFGVNLALLEGAELAHAVARKSTLEDALVHYEETMFARSGPLAVGANDALDRFFAPGSALPPDPEAEHRRYREGAATYRRQQRAGEACHDEAVDAPHCASTQGS